MAFAISYAPHSLELLAQCQVELDRIQRDLDGLDDVDAQSRLARVERAISWLRAGTYGFCGVCGRRLTDAALRAAPEQLACDRCAKPVRVPFAALECATW
jgi:hypothetical protein